MSESRTVTSNVNYRVNTGVTVMHDTLGVFV